MKKQSFTMKKTVLAGTTALTLLSAPLLIANTLIAPTTSTDMTSFVLAAEDGSGSEGHKGAGAKQGGSNQQGKHGASSGGKKGIDKVLDEGDDDSDRPEWAQGNKDANPHSGGGKPGDAGSKKGDDYGDIIVLLRNPITGEPIVQDGEYLICLDLACTSTTPTVDREVPEGVTAIEVEFGRASVGRAPSKVTDHSLDEAISKLTAEGAVISVDTAGRITITVDGVTSTIDSPLENLALYIDLMEGLTSNDTSVAEAALGSLATLETAASLLAGVSDKTGDITVDYVVNYNVIVDIVNSGEYYDFSQFIYTRDYPTDYVYNYTLDGGVTILSATLNVNDYLEAVNGSITGDAGVTLFSEAADDSVEVIELLHTQIYSEILPGTVTP